MDPVPICKEVKLETAAHHLIRISKLQRPRASRQAHNLSSVYQLVERFSSLASRNIKREKKRSRRYDSSKHKESEHAHV